MLLLKNSLARFTALIILFSFSIWIPRSFYSTAIVKSQLAAYHHRLAIQKLTKANREFRLDLTADQAEEALNHADTVQLLRNSQVENIRERRSRPSR